MVVVVVVVVVVPAAGVVVPACRRLGMRTPGCAGALGVVADGRLVAVLAAAWLVAVVSNAAVERSRAAEELLCAPVVDAVGVRAPELDTTRRTHNGNT